MDEGDALPVVGDGIVQRGADQPLAAFGGDRLDADAGGLGEADLFHAHLLHQETDDFLGFGGAGIPFDPGVDVLGVLAEDDHVGLFRSLHRGRHPLEITDGPDTGKEVQFLPQGHVQGTDAAADGGGQGALDGDPALPDGINGLAGEPDGLVIDPVGLLTGVEFHPRDGALPAVGLVNGGVPHLHGSPGHVGTDAVAFDEADNGMIRDLQFPLCIDLDQIPRGDRDMLISHPDTSPVMPESGVFSGSASGNGPGPAEDVPRYVPDII